MPRLRQEYLRLAEQAQSLAQHAEHTLTIADKTMIQVLQAILVTLKAICDALDEFQDGIHVTAKIAGKQIPASITLTAREDVPHAQSTQEAKAKTD